MSRGVLRTQLSGLARRPSRLLLTGLAVLVASFVVYATVLAQQITLRSLLDSVSGTPAAVDLVVQGGSTDTTTLAKLRAVPGVAEAAGRIDGGGQINGQYLDVTADPGTGPLATTHVVHGRYPSAPGEIAVSPRTAERMALPIGTVVSMTTDWDDKGVPSKPVRVKVVGVATARDDFGGSAYASQSTVSELFHGAALNQIDLHYAAGADEGAARAQVERIVAATPAPTDGGSPATVTTGDAVRLQEAEDASSDVDSLFAVVAMFVAIAVVAAGLVATSTFRIVFAQRMRQLALLRTVGAGRGSITRALAAEGALIGVTTGLAGVLIALAAGQLIPVLARALGAHIASPGVPLLPALGVVALATVITVLAVLAPAVSAAKVAPLEALRASSTTGGRQDIGKLRWASGLLLAAGAALLAAYVLRHLPGRNPAPDYSVDRMLLAVVASGAFAFFALMALGPVVIRPVLALLGWPVRRFGSVGRLAVGGVGGAPRRAAAVSIVVALGVTLIAGVLVAGASVQTLAERESATSVPADYELTASGDDGIPAAMLTQAQARTELAHVTPYRRLSEVTVTGSQVKLEAVDLDLAALPTLKKLDTTAGRLGDLGPGKLVVSAFTADVGHLKLGDVATVHDGKKSTRLTVVAVLPDTAPLGSGMVLSASDLTALGAPATSNGILADAARPGEQGRTAGQQALSQVTGGRPGFGIDVLADQRDQETGVITMLVAIAVGLVGLTVLIAVVGVGTTTALSVVERVRESGLLRAVGLSRGGLRLMLTTESSLYGLIGAAIGLALGVPYAWLAVKALPVNAPLRLPIGQLAVVFVVLIAFTALAGVLPARRAAKVSPVVALSTD